MRDGTKICYSHFVRCFCVAVICYSCKHNFLRTKTTHSRQNSSVPNRIYQHYPITKPKFVSHPILLFNLPVCNTFSKLNLTAKQPSEFFVRSPGPIRLIHSGPRTRPEKVKELFQILQPPQNFTSADKFLFKFLFSHESLKSIQSRQVSGNQIIGAVKHIRFILNDRWLFSLTSRNFQRLRIVTKRSLKLSKLMDTRMSFATMSLTWFPAWSWIEVSQSFEKRRSHNIPIVALENDSAGYDQWRIS
jgi:hypothetical protein